MCRVRGPDAQVRPAGQQKITHGSWWPDPCYRPTDRPPARELGAIWITLTTPTGEQERLDFVLSFRVSVDTFSPYPRCGWHGDGFVGNLFLPLKARLAFLSLFLRTLPASLPCRSEVWEWVLRSRIFDSRSSSWSRGFHESPIILHIRLIRVG